MGKLPDDIQSTREIEPYLEEANAEALELLKRDLKASGRLEVAIAIKNILAPIMLLHENSAVEEGAEQLDLDIIAQKRKPTALEQKLWELVCEIVEKNGITE